MEAYILDSLYRRTQVVDKFESLIWTERFRTYGDFEMTMHSTRENRNRLKPGTRLATNVSYRVMTVETFEDKIDADGKRVLTTKGRSLEQILEDRVAKKTLSNLTTEPTWVITGAPAAIARQIFHDICVLGKLNPGDIIPFVVEGTIMPTDTIVEPIGPITAEIDPTTVYTAIKDICDAYDLGFRLVRNFDSSQLYFDIYAGSNRTSSQKILPSVVFAPELDNLQNISELSTIAVAKNVAYVFSPAGFQVVYAFGVDPLVAGFERRILVVKADDITIDNPNVTAALIQRGKEELSKNVSFTAFDGEVNPNSLYKYGRDYHLGDLVDMRNTDGATNTMRVEEQIFVSDKEGDRSYPTLANKDFINPGSWRALDYNKIWTDFGVSEFWADQI